MMRILACAVAVAALVMAQSPVESAKAEPNLEKRSEKALQAAQKVLDELRRNGDLGDRAAVKSALGEIRAGVELCVDSLEASGKDARRSPKYFKKAVLKDVGGLAKGIQPEGGVMLVNSDGVPILTKANYHDFVGQFFSPTPHKLGKISAIQYSGVITQKAAQV